MNKLHIPHALLVLMFSAFVANAEVSSPEDISNVEWQKIIDGNHTDDITSNETLWVKSGSIDGDVIGGTKYTLIGNSSDNTGPTITGDNKVRGSNLGYSATDKSEASVYIYGGKYEDKVSGIHYGSGMLYDASKGANSRTGNLYIYGGSFDSDITGYGMARDNEVHSANTNVQILGAIENGAGMGVFGGVAGYSKSTASLVGNTNVTVSGAGNTTFVAGGNRMAGNITGNVSVNIVNGGTVGGILGGNFAHDSETSTSTIDGNITVNIADGNVVKKNFSVTSGIVANGVIAGGLNTNVTGSTTINISGNSSVVGGITAGSVGWKSVNVAIGNINISGGSIDISGNQIIVEPIEGLTDVLTLSTITVTNSLFGGNIAAGVLDNATYTMGTSNITITGGSISGGNVFGGGLAKGGKFGLFNKTTYTAVSTVAKTNITIDSSENAVSINGNIYGGGRADNYGTVNVTESANITFSGKSENLNFTGSVYGNGLGNGGTVSDAKKYFNFKNFSGSFANTINNFDVLTIENSSLSGNINLANVSKVIFSGANEFSGTLIGTTSVVIDANGELKLTIATDNQLGSSLVNNGSLIVYTNATEGSFKIAEAYSGNGSVLAYGGTVSGNIFTVSEQIVIADNNTSATIDAGANANVKVDEKLTMSFNNTESVSVNAIENKKEDFEKLVIGDAKFVDAYSFDIEMSVGDSVVVSFYVGDANLSVSDFEIYHKGNNDSEWKLATDSDITNIEYKDGVLSFVAHHFSDYAAVAGDVDVLVPEASTIATIFGVFALAFVMYRRRK